MNADKLNRPSANPGGMECQTCGRIFIGDESHSECGLCHNTRPTAVASHAEGEVVAWRWRDDVRPGLPWKTTTDVDVIDQLRAKGGYEIEPLFAHPPRSVDEALKVPDGYLLVRDPIHWGQEENKAWHRAIPSVRNAFIALANVTPKPAAMAARGGEK